MTQRVYKLVVNLYFETYFTGVVEYFRCILYICQKCISPIVLCYITVVKFNSTIGRNNCQFNTIQRTVNNHSEQNFAVKLPIYVLTYVLKHYCTSITNIYGCNGQGIIPNFGRNSKFRTYQIQYILDIQNTSNRHSVYCLCITKTSTTLCLCNIQILAEHTRIAANTNL